MGSDYKAAKEGWVSDLTGSTVLHVNLISSVALVSSSSSASNFPDRQPQCSIALYSALASRTTPLKPISFPIAWMILVLPLLLSMTLFANSPAWLSLLLLVPTGLLLLLPQQPLGTPLPSPGSPRPRQSSTQPSLTPQIPTLPAVTVYRAHMMLMTILGILAVDFPVFPRTLAKCETFGVSLMDLGVGSFVFSQGLVSAIPILKNPSYLSAPAVPKILSVTWKSLPIIFLGVVRVLLVKGTEYPVSELVLTRVAAHQPYHQEHESEYGTHWNFFITLALLPILQVILHPIIKHIPIALLGVLVASAQQMTLSSLGMHDFLLNAPRTGIISANKEGFVSLAGECPLGLSGTLSEGQQGYLAVHLFGLSAGTIILPPSPKYFSRALKTQGRARRNSDPNDKRNTLFAPRENDHTAIELFSYTVVWWTLLSLLKIFGIGGADVSRRMVNIQYIFWMAAFNTSFILGYLVLDMSFNPSRSVYSQQSKLKVPVDKLDTNHSDLQQHMQAAPPLLEAINKNGLVLFLVANVATGLVNLTVQTMYTSDRWAMTILSGYTFALCWFAWIFRGTRLCELQDSLLSRG
ncbi:hypothetical protein DXG01_001042 [Tephrocybe rancida]|nr:hypothetical protein DXG01_001042 [Tephrocybe rancida]